MVSSRKPSLRDDPSPFSPSRGFFMVGFGWPPGRLPLVNLDADLLGPAGFQHGHEQAFGPSVNNLDLDTRLQ